MELITSCIVHARILQKLAKGSCIENKEAGRQLPIFMYFPAAHC